MSVFIPENDFCLCRQAASNAFDGRVLSPTSGLKQHNAPSPKISTEIALKFFFSCFALLHVFKEIVLTSAQ